MTPKLFARVRLVLQRVTRAEVRVAVRLTGRIGTGFLVLAGFNTADRDDQRVWMDEKIARLRLKVETGEFGAMMDVEMVNDGPVTLVREK